MINWGILGAGKIALRFAKSLESEPNSRLTAVSCRTQAKADAFAAEHGNCKAYAGHEKLLADPSIDAIYLALPHGLHHEWAIKALTSGKAVLCEKPAALSADQVKEMIHTASHSHRLFMEAMKPRFVPLYGHLKKLLSEGCIGELRSVEASLCNQVPPQYIAHSYHTQPIQGGCLLDCGIYCASWLEDLMDGEVAVRQVSSSITSDIDYYVHADLTIGGRPALLECAFDRLKPRQAILRGTEGHIVVDDLHRPQSMTICPDGRESQTIRMPYVVDDFYGEICHFVRCLQEGIPESPIMSFGASIRCAHILDCIRENIPG